MHHNNQKAVARSCEAGFFARPGVLRLFRICSRYHFLFPHLDFDNPSHNGPILTGRLTLSMGIGKSKIRMESVVWWPSHLCLTEGSHLPWHRNVHSPTQLGTSRMTVDMTSTDPGQHAPCFLCMDGGFRVTAKVSYVSMSSQPIIRANGWFRWWSKAHMYHMSISTANHR